MSKNTIQDILPLIEKPSRYLGSEINVTGKPAEGVKLHIALAFPELYEIGTSHFGIQILYHILNQQAGISAERVFCPAKDMKDRMAASGTPLFSLESRTPIHQFDILGFSLLYELNYTNVLSMLDLARIPFSSSQRDGSHPILIAGGPCTSNPEPVADLFDAMVVGDGEEVILEMARMWMEWKGDASGDRETLLNRWSEIPGVYIPSLFEPREQADGTIVLRAKNQNHQIVQRAIVADLDGASFPDSPIVPYGRPVHDRLRIEVARGCTRGCRFCQAGMIYRPVRERSPETVLDLTRRSLAATGYEDVSLLSLSTGDYRCIAEVMKRLMDYPQQQIAVSLPSLRVETLTPELMESIKKVRKTGFTIAPEAGSRRLREMINKHISEEEIFKTVGDAFRLGWQVIKLYFMVGFPTETQADLRAIVEMIKRLKRMRTPGGGKARINVSVATFIPKPHTPFQWAAQISLDESKEKMHWLKRELRIPGVHFKWQQPEVSFLEGLWARGDRRLTPLLTAAYRRGCEFDGWSDTFDYPAWTEALSETGIDPALYVVRQRGFSEPLPWDHIDTGVAKTFLMDEWQKALAGEFTPDCRDGQCQDCGVCDFQSIAPVVFPYRSEDSLGKEPPKTAEQTEFRRLRISFSKLDEGRFFGHLELVNIFIRALRRAKIPLRYSQGFHPKPKISFRDPLPIGIESQKEFFTIETPDPQKHRDLVDRINDQLPRGIRVTGCDIHPNIDEGNTPTTVDYCVTAEKAAFDEGKLGRLLEKEPILLTRTSRKGKKTTIDLRDAIQEIDVPTPSRLLLTLKSMPGRTVRPPEILVHLFQLSPSGLSSVRIVKTKTRRAS